MKAPTSLRAEKTDPSRMIKVLEPMETQTFENEGSILRTFTTNIRLAVNGSKFLRKQRPFWSRAADGVCLMLITSKHHFGFSNVRLLHEDKGQQCHKIYWQVNAKNPDICPRQFNAFCFNLLNVTSRDDYYHTKKCWLLLRQLFSWFGSNAQIRISHLCRERITSSFHKGLLPLAREDETFKEAAPCRFGSEFAKPFQTSNNLFSPSPSVKTFKRWKPQLHERWRQRLSILWQKNYQDQPQGSSQKIMVLSTFRRYSSIKKNNSQTIFMLMFNHQKR